MCNGYRHGTRRGDNKLCTTHTIRLDDLEELTLTLVRHAVNATLDVDKFVEALLATAEKDDSEQKSLARLKKREGELKVLTRRVFEQNALGKIDDDTFADLYNGYQTELKELTVKVESIERRQREMKDREANARLFAKIAAMYTEATLLSRDMITDLVAKIVVHQAEGTKQKNRSQTIDFYFRFIGRLPDDFFKNLVSL